MLEVLSPEIQRFIRDHENEDEKALLLKHKTIFDLPTTVIVQQIIGRRKAKEKLPAYYNTEGILYPPAINLEQSSSEQTAQFKMDLIQSLLKECHLAVDLTGGFGIDSYFLSKIFSGVEYVEPNESLLLVAAHNHRQLGARNIQYNHATAESFLEEFKKPADLIYIDPSRRVGSKKVSSLKESEPAVTELLPKIFSVTKHLVVKASPMLDITLAMKDLAHVGKIAVVSVDNECKEVLFFCERDHNKEPVIETFNLSDTEESFKFFSSEEKTRDVTYSDPLQYLYEPNASILKAGAFKSIGSAFQIHKIHQNTHLYTSDKLIPNFPGRIFKIEENESDERKIQSAFPDKKANVTTRNYPLTPEQLKKKFKLTDGGKKFLIAFFGQTKKFLTIATRVK